MKRLMNGTKIDISDSTAPIAPYNAEECVRFLADYATLLLRSGATCTRLERNLRRIANCWRLSCTITIMPRHIHLSVSDDASHSHTYITSTGHHVINYNIITQLSELSWNIVDSHLTVIQAYRSLNEIAKSPHINTFLTLLAVSCANCAFCRLFGGDSVAMAVVFIATFIGLYLKHLLIANMIDVRISFTISATISSILAAGAKLFQLGQTPEIAIATSVLYLVPGIPFLNAFSDMIDRHYICFLCRMIDAVILTCCLSFGLCIGMKLMNVGMF